MKTKILILTAMVMSIVSSCGHQNVKKELSEGKDSITISYRFLKNDDPAVKECTNQEPQYAFNVTLQGNIDGTPYKVYQVHVKEGKIERSEIELKKVCLADSIQDFLFASIMESEDSVRIICSHQEKNEWKIAIPAYQCILMETYPAVKQTINESIPLIAFTEGAYRVFERNGAKLEGLDYCDVRNARLHPSQWFEKFNIKDYVYFEISFQVSYTGIGRHI